MTADQVNNIPNTLTQSVDPAYELISGLSVRVSDCGCYTTETADDYPAFSRKKDPKDYLLLFISEGHGDFYFDDGHRLLEKGTYILYRPDETVRCTFPDALRSAACYICFTGPKAEAFLKSFGLPDTRYSEIGEARFFTDITTKMQHELELRQTNCDIMCTVLLTELFVRLSRMTAGNGVSSGTRSFAPVLDLMHNHYYQNHTIDEYAALCGMSTCYFIRSFRQHTGYSPHAYLIRIRMEEAKTLLAETDMNISEVSFAVGYENPLYFSRLFKSHTGQSPTEYKKGVFPS